MATEGQEQCKPMREKYWSELDDQERVERMRLEIRHLKSQNKQLIESVRQLLNHTHASQCSSPSIPIDSAFGSRIRGYGIGSGGAADRDDLYI